MREELSSSISLHNLHVHVQHVHPVHIHVLHQLCKYRYYLLELEQDMGHGVMGPWGHESEHAWDGFMKPTLWERRYLLTLPSSLTHTYTHTRQQ